MKVKRAKTINEKEEITLNGYVIVDENDIQVVVDIFPTKKALKEYADSHGIEIE